jgi:nitroreductase
VRESIAGQQAFAKDAPLSLLLVSDQTTRNRKNEHFGAMDAGYVSQNIYLACTAMGLQTVARASMDADTLRQELQLGDEVWLELNHPVGYGK